MMGDFEAARRLLLSCSICGTYYGYSDLVVACEQADAAALEEAYAALYAERTASVPGLNVSGDAAGGGCTARQMYAELAALIAEVERGESGGGRS
jgi:hypothetical protein